MSHPRRGDPLAQCGRFAVALLLLVAACRTGTSTSPSEPVENAVRRFYAGMAASDPGENRRAMQAMTPEQDDFEALFPGHGATLWAVWGPERARLVEEAPSHAHEYREVLPIGPVRSEDLRQHADLVLQRSLAELSPETRVLGVSVEVSGAQQQRSASAFVFARGRWLWIWNLERAASIIARGRGG